MKPKKKTVRYGIALRPEDQQIVAKLQKKLSTPLAKPGVTDILRAGLEALSEKADSAA